MVWRWFMTWVCDLGTIFYKSPTYHKTWDSNTRTHRFLRTLQFIKTLGGIHLGLSLANYPPTVLHSQLPLSTRHLRHTTVIILLYLKTESVDRTPFNKLHRHSVKEIYLLCIVTTKLPGVSSNYILHKCFIDRDTNLVWPTSSFPRTIDFWFRDLLKLYANKFCLC